MKEQDIQVASIKDQIYTILKEEIINNTLKSGEKLAEQAIATRFNVSRSPVREAIKQLTGDGLVVNVPNRGAYVKVPTAKEIEEMQTVRHIYEEYAISQLPNAMTEDRRRHFEKLRVGMLQALEENNFAAYYQLERKMAAAFIRLTENSIIEDSYRKVYTMMTNYSGYLHRNEQSKLAETVNERVRLIDAILAGDVESAMQELHQHAEHAAHYIRNIVK